MARVCSDTGAERDLLKKKNRKKKSFILKDDVIFPQN